MSSSFTIYDSQDSQRLMAMVGRDLDLDPKRFTPRSLAGQVSNLKNELIDEDEAARRCDMVTGLCRVRNGSEAGDPHSIETGFVLV